MTNQTSVIQDMTNQTSVIQDMTNQTSVIQDMTNRTSIIQDIISGVPATYTGAVAPAYLIEQRVLVTIFSTLALLFLIQTIYKFLLHRHYQDPIGTWTVNVKTTFQQRFSASPPPPPPPPPSVGHASGRMNLRMIQPRRTPFNPKQMMPKLYQCKICVISFASKTQVLNHICGDPKDKLYLCVHCQARFKHRNTWTDHEAQHSGVWPFTCKTCGWKFARATPLRKHMVIHSTDRPFECKHCWRRFYKKNQLDTHTISHLQALHEKKLAARYANKFVHPRVRAQWEEIVGVSLRKGATPGTLPDSFSKPVPGKSGNAVADIFYDRMKRSASNVIPPAPPLPTPPQSTFGSRNQNATISYARQTAAPSRAQNSPVPNPDNTRSTFSAQIDGSGGSVNIPITVGSHSRNSVNSANVRQTFPDWPSSHSPSTAAQGSAYNMTPINQHSAIQSLQSTPQHTSYADSNIVSSTQGSAYNMISTKQDSPMQRLQSTPQHSLYADSNMVSSTQGSAYNMISTKQDSPMQRLQSTPQHSLYADSNMVSSTQGSAYNMTAIKQDSSIKSLQSTPQHTPYLASNNILSSTHGSAYNMTAIKQDSSIKSLQSTPQHTPYLASNNILSSTHGSAYNMTAIKQDSSIQSLQSTPQHTPYAYSNIVSSSQGSAYNNMASIKQDSSIQSLPSAPQHTSYAASNIVSSSQGSAYNMISDSRYSLNPYDIQSLQPTPQPNSYLNSKNTAVSTQGSAYLTSSTQPSSSLPVQSLQSTPQPNSYVTSNNTVSSTQGIRTEYNKTSDSRPSSSLSVQSTPQPNSYNITSNNTLPSSLPKQSLQSKQHPNYSYISSDNTASSEQDLRSSSLSSQDLQSISQLNSYNNMVSNSPVLPIQDQSIFSLRPSAHATSSVNKIEHFDDAMGILNSNVSGFPDVSTGFVQSSNVSADTSSLVRPPGQVLAPPISGISDTYQSDHTESGTRSRRNIPQSVVANLLASCIRSSEQQVGANDSQLGTQTTDERYMNSA
eukprot:811188_1